MGTVFKRFRGSNHEIDTSIKAIEASYRTIFAGAGAGVLADILFKLGFFEKISPEDTEAVARHNVAIELLTTCKVIIPDETGLQPANVVSLTNQLMGAHERTGR